MRLIFTSVLLIAAISLSARAEIIYRDHDPDSVLVTVGTSPTMMEIDLDNNGTMDFIICHHLCTQFFSGYGDSEVLALEVEPHHEEPVVIEYGELISASSETWFKSGGFSMNMEKTWIGQTDKYIGLRIIKNGSYYYGWLRISIPEDGTSCIVKDIAFENTPDTPINAGNSGSLAVNDLSSVQNPVIAYPNPVSDILTLENFQAEENLEIYDINGGIVELYITEKSEGCVYIDVTGIPNGTYFIHVNKQIISFVVSR